jgi:hypothetical protein
MVGVFIPLNNNNIFIGIGSGPHGLAIPNTRDVAELTSTEPALSDFYGAKAPKI